MAESELYRVLAAEQYRCKLIGECEWEILSDLLAEEVLHVHATGTVQDKAAYLAYVQTRPRVPVRRDLRVSLLSPETAVMVGDLYNTADGNLTEDSAPLLVMQIWVLRDGNWKQATFQATRKA